ncbi:MAG: hypothetical protein ACREUL_09860 [Steroidobacteraceae bacterium]
MSVSKTSPLRHLAIAAAAALVVGCASAPQNTSSHSAVAQTPASVAKLVNTADFLQKAQDEGWAPQVRNGHVLYCKDVTPVDSRLPERQCLDKNGVTQMMLAEEQQREQMQRAAANAGSSGG